MKKILTLISLFIIATSSMLAAVSVVKGRVPVSDLDVSLYRGRLMLSMNLDVTDFKLGKDRQLMIVPVLHNADSTESFEFTPVYLAGHNLYFKHLRDNDLLPEATLYRQAKTSTIVYKGQMPDAPWAEDALLSVYYRVGGCCDALVEEGVDLLAPVRKPVIPTFSADYCYVSPVADSVKTRELKKQAYVDFPVDKIVIYPDYRNNTVELAKIIATIDSVRNDADITVDAISIKGFASPEGSYDHNVYLAKNRTIALKNYVQNLYRFAPDFIKTDYEPEDWAGLRKFVEGSGLAHREEILAIIDSDLAPDLKNTKIQRTYPEEYDFLLKTIYPALRHSDYKIDYTIRQFTSLEDILRVLAEAPQKLSLAEFYRAAQSMEPGSVEYNNVFETAVRMYPADPVANLNAANSSMSRGDLESAARYLDRAGDSPEAIYARGILAAKSQNYEQALQFFRRAAKLKVADAPAAIDSVQRIIDWQNELADPDHKTTYINI